MTAKSGYLQIGLAFSPPNDMGRAAGTGYESYGTFQSVRSNIEMDCEDHQLRDISMKFFRKPMGKGKVVFQEMGTGNFQSWPDGSLNAMLHEVVCP
jgi:hypothetical protein